MKEYYSPNEFNSGSDSDRIQAAIDKAAETQVGKVVIPKYNELKDCMLWTIDKTIRIPSDMTIILDNSHLIMADGVMCKMFENSSFSLPSEKTLTVNRKTLTY